MSPKMSRIQSSKPAFANDDQLLGKHPVTEASSSSNGKDQLNSQLASGLQYSPGTHRELPASSSKTPRLRSLCPASWQGPAPLNHQCQCQSVPSNVQQPTIAQAHRKSSSSNGRIDVVCTATSRVSWGNPSAAPFTSVATLAGERARLLACSIRPHSCLSECRCKPPQELQTKKTRGMR